MFIYPLALLLVIHAFHPRADFGAGKDWCMKMCQLGCSKNPREAASSCAEISHSGAAPWIDPYAGPLQESFKYKWCQTKYQIAVVANDAADGYYFQSIKYPATGLNYGPYKEVNHLDWIAPACNKTTAPSCKSNQKASTLVDGLQWWLDNGGNDCRSLADAELCVEDCSTTCLKWCECGWGATAEAAYKTGKIRRPHYDGTSGNWTCLEVYTFDKECTCSHGTPVDSKVCVSHGKEQCGACNLGYTLQNDSKACHKNICSCDRGQSVSAEKCFVHGATKCSESACDSGFHFESDDCKANVCQCRHGSAVASENCATHLENHCKQCNPGFHLSRNSKECEENICECDHGIPVAGQECFVHGETKCRENSCKPGYHMESDDCRENICKCNYGIPGAKQDCLVHGATKCVKNTCDSGYHFESDDCKANVCQCKHGAAVESENCATHLENHCQLCKTGFHLSQNNKECEENICTCDHGIPEAGQECSVHGGTKCRENSCEPGYHIESDDCKGNICTCNYGFPATWQDCLVHGATKCTENTCNLGYHFESDDCKANRCQCKHGAAVEMENCATHLENHCQLCNTGFHLSQNNKECEENICNCDHGRPVHTEECLVHGATKCRTNECEPGFHFESDDCKENICKCSHGIPAAGQECLVHGETKCRENSCFRGYHMELDNCEVCRVEYGIDYFGNDLPIATSLAPTWSACGQLCDQQSKCLFWTWSGTCYLKHDDAGRFRRDGKISGSKGCGPYEGACPAPACVHEWSYGGYKQTACSNPSSEQKGLWCPTSLQGGNYLVGSEKRKFCVSCTCGTMILSNSKILPIVYGELDYIGDDNNDKVYKLQVADGYLVQVFQHRQFGGEKRQFQVGSWEMEGDWRTRISSYKCLGPCGTMLLLNSEIIPILYREVRHIGHENNDMAYKLQVAEGYLVQVFEHTDFRGEERQFRRGSWEMEGAWRTKISSYKCLRDFVGSRLLAENHDMTLPPKAIKRNM